MSSLGAPWRPSNPVRGEAATTTGVTTHRRRAHATVHRRTRDYACQPAVRRIGIRTRVFSHSNTSSVALPVAGANSSAVQLGGGTIKLCYGRPSARGRKVMGELDRARVQWAGPL